MQGLPEKLTFSVEEAAELLGVGRNSAYEAIRRGELPSIAIGRRRLIARHALAGFLGMPTEAAGSGPPPTNGDATARAEEEEWTYVISVKRLRRGERVRIEPGREPVGRWER